MATVTMEFSLQGEKELQRAIKRAGDRVEDLLASGLFREAEGIMAKSKPEVPVDQGVLRASGFVRKPKRAGVRTSVDLGYGGAAKSYALFVHEGTGPAAGRSPYFPPPEALKGWARRTLGDESLAFIVARAIGQRGTKGVKFLERPLRAAVNGMARRLAAHIRQGLGRKGRGAR